MKNLEEVLEQYTKEAFDPKQPFLLAVYNLAKTYGNDYALGAKVRELVQKFEDVNRQQISKELDEQLKNILNGQN